MACKIAGLSVGGFGFFGGALGGVTAMVPKSANIMNAVTSNPVFASAQGAISVASGSVGDTLLNPVTAISSAAAGAVSSTSFGSELAASLTGGVLPEYSSLMTDPSSLVSSIQAHATQFIPADISSGLQIFDQVQAFSLSSLDLMPTITRALGTDFGGISGIAKNFTDGGFLGDAIGNFDQLLTNGMGSLTDGLSGSFGDLGTSFTSLGKFGNVADFGNLMQPGQIASQLLDNGLGDIGNIAQTIESVGIPLDDLTNPLYQGKLQEVLNGVTNLTDLIDIQQVMGSGLNLNKLGDLTDVTKVLDGNLGKSFTDFADLGSKLQDISTGAVSSLGELGETMATMVDGSDLSLLVGQTDILPQGLFDNISNVYGQGTGPDGAVLMRDVMGLAAGYGIEDRIPTLNQALQLLDSDGVTGTVESMYGELSAGLAGSFTDVSAETVTDPRTGFVYGSLDDFVFGKTSQIDGEFTSIASSTSNVTQDLLTAAKSNWTASTAQLSKELGNVSVSDIDTTLVQAGNKASMLSFAQQLTTYGQDGKNRGEYLEKIAAPTVTGNYMKFGLREGKNLEAFGGKGIDYAGILQDEPETILPFDSSV